VNPNGECRDCGARVRFVRVIPTQLRKGTQRAWIPMDLTVPADIAPSHALNFARTRARPVTSDTPPEDHEVPALTHFATCPTRRKDPTDATQAEDPAPAGQAGHVRSRSA
jgi:hypothetical protein